MQRVSGLPQNVRFDLSGIVKRSREDSGRLSSGVSGLLKKNKGQVFWGEAKLLEGGTVEVSSKRAYPTRPTLPEPRGALGPGTYTLLDTATMLEVINNSAAASPVIGHKTKMLVSGVFAPAFSVQQMTKDLDIALSVARSCHCPLPLVAQIRQIFEIAYAAGDGDKDYFVLSKE
jgi:hypothetical protein